jgi:hypothetical protein
LGIQRVKRNRKKKFGKGEAEHAGNNAPISSLKPENQHQGNKALDQSGEKACDGQFPEPDRFDQNRIVHHTKTAQDEVQRQYRDHLIYPWVLKVDGRQWSGQKTKQAEQNTNGEVEPKGCGKINLIHVFVVDDSRTQTIVLKQPDKSHKEGGHPHEPEVLREQDPRCHGSHDQMDAPVRTFLKKSP